MQRSIDRILTTHTGSLPRPDDLFRLLYDRDAGEAVDPELFDRTAQAAVNATCRRQSECGIDVINDGEMSKVTYSTYVKDRLSGFGGVAASPRRRGADMLEFPDFAERFYASLPDRNPAMPACDGPIAWKDRAAFAADIRRLRTALAGVSPRDAFMSAASPGVISLFLENQYYATREQYLETLADVMREEYEAIAAAGFILQLDCPDLGFGYHGTFAGSTVSDYLAVVEVHVAAINRAVVNIPADRIRLHLCWGNYAGPHNHDIPLGAIFEQVLEAKVGGISFEGANPRHEHEWSLFRDVTLPADKVIIPGVIDSTTNFIEHPELVAQRIVRYAELVGRENVIAGCDCGFATFAGTSPIAPSIAWAKLRSLAEGARIASSRLWSHTLIAS